MFSGFGLKPPASGFQPYSYSSLKTSPSLTSKAVPSVLASVCWSLQCLISALTQGGSGGHFFRLTCQSFCGEGGMLQTTLACARSVSATLGLPLLTACVLSLSTLLRLWVALPETV